MCLQSPSSIQRSSHLSELNVRCTHALLFACTHDILHAPALRKRFFYAYKGSVHRYYESRRRLFNDSKPERVEVALQVQMDARRKERRKRVSVYMFVHVYSVKVYAVSFTCSYTNLGRSSCAHLRRVISTCQRKVKEVMGIKSTGIL